MPANKKDLKIILPKEKYSSSEEEKEIEKEDNPEVSGLNKFLREIPPTKKEKEKKQFLSIVNS